jgi:hypothetical protein
MTQAISTPKFKNGVLVKKRNPRHPDVRNFWLKRREKKDITYKNDFGRIGTVIKTEIRAQKRKDRKEPQKVFYCEVLWRGRDKTEWIFQNRLERVEGL